MIDTLFYSCSSAGDRSKITSDFKELIATTAIHAAYSDGGPESSEFLKEHFADQLTNYVGYDPISGKDCETPGAILIGEHAPLEEVQNI